MSTNGVTVIIETTGFSSSETVFWKKGNDLYIGESGVKTTPWGIFQ
ncbi:hypothetical protein [Flavicella sp.]